MYLNTQVDDQMEQYTGFFDNQWKLLVQALIEIGSDPDNQKLQARIRSLATILQLTAVTIDHLQNQQQKVMPNQRIFLGELYSIQPVCEAIATAIVSTS